MKESQLSISTCATHKKGHSSAHRTKTLNEKQKGKGFCPVHKYDVLRYKLTDAVAEHAAILSPKFTQDSFGGEP